MNPNFDVDYLLTLRPSFYVVCYYLSGNPNVELRHITQNPNAGWSHELIANHSDCITIDDMIRSKSIVTWNWNSLSLSTRHVNARVVIANPTLPWHWDFLLSNPSVNVRELLASLHLLPVQPYIYTTNIIHRSDFRFDIVYDHPDLKWSWSTLQAQPNFPFDLVIRFPTVEWNWAHLTEKTDLQQVVAHPDLPWVWHKLSDRKDLHIEHVLAMPTKPWSWSRVSCLPTLDTVRQHVTLPWNWEVLTKKFSMEEIDAYPELPWCGTALCNRLKQFAVAPLRHRILLDKTLQELQFMPVGRFCSLPLGGVSYQRQLSDLQTLMATVN